MVGAVGAVAERGPTSEAPAGTGRDDLPAVPGTGSGTEDDARIAGPEKDSSASTSIRPTPGWGRTRTLGRGPVLPLIPRWPRPGSTAVPRPPDTAGLPDRFVPSATPSGAITCMPLIPASVRLHTRPGHLSRHTRDGSRTELFRGHTGRNRLPPIQRPRPPDRGLLGNLRTKHRLGRCQDLRTRGGCPHPACHKHRAEAFRRPPDRPPAPRIDSRGAASAPCRWCLIPVFRPFP